MDGGRPAGPARVAGEAPVRRADSVSPATRSAPKTRISRKSPPVRPAETPFPRTGALPGTGGPGSGRDRADGRSGDFRLPQPRNPAHVAADSSPARRSRVEAHEGAGLGWRRLNRVSERLRSRSPYRLTAKSSTTSPSGASTVNRTGASPEYPTRRLLTRPPPCDTVAGSKYASPV